MALFRGTGEAGFATQVLAALFAPDVLAVVRETVMMAGLATALALALGLPLGILAGRVATPWIKALLAVPFVLPTAAAGVGWLALGVPFGAPTVVLALAAYNVPWVALAVARAREQVPVIQHDVLATLGAEPWARFVWSTWPAVRGAWTGAALQSFGYCVMGYGLVVLLGGGPPVETLEVTLAQTLRSAGGQSLPAAAASGIWQMILGGVPWILASRWVSGGRLLAREAGAATGRQTAAAWERWIALAGALLLLSPLAGLLPRIWGGVSIFSDSTLWPQLRAALGVSAELSLGAGACALAVAGLAVAADAGPVLSLALTIPAGISVMVLGLGLWMAYGRWVDPFEGSAPAIIVLEAALLVPLAYRSLQALRGGFAEARYAALRTLGAGAFRAWWISEWPRWRAPVLGLFGILVALALGEVSAISLFYSEKLVNVPLLVMRWSAQHRIGEARDLAAILALACAALASGAAWI
ncbi:MAG TPA: hypothetical protein VL588_03470 [Bdellovibrionota bacterium]|nr:hypothetical protein [Bdellovibrionota bacterium]